VATTRTVSDRRQLERDALDDAVRAIAGVLDLEHALELIVDRVRDLADGQYAALGIIGDDGTLERFITSGISGEERERIGQPPAGRGLLGVIIRESRSIRIADLSTDPRRYGFPPHHPPMRSFLGVPVRLRGRAIGNFYLTNKRGAEEFSEDDQELVERFALHAAVAIDNARLHEEVTRLALVDERDRIGRDLHDGVIQRLYAVTLSLDDVPELMDESPSEARDRVERSIVALQSAIGDIRGFIYDLRPGLSAPAEVEQALRDVADEIERSAGIAVAIDVDPGLADLDPRLGAALVAVAREALSNTGRHAGAAMASVSLATQDGGLRLAITDDGHGFDPSAPRDGRHQGLANMAERIRASGGRLVVESAPGRGTTILADLPAPARTA
jgi:signal transduction histidine kinase